ncbi:MAG: hypothetical protein IJW15_02780 [Clostridia bacterium]|nr:hypothetical protein [Clostridia bacterium]
MRRFNQGRKNPNPPWPAKQPVVVVPKGSNASAIGYPEKKTYEIAEDSVPAVTMTEPANMEPSGDTYARESEREIRREPIMGVPRSKNQNSLGMSPQIRPEMEQCSDMEVSGYLCGQIGKFVKLEFLFGENTHMEKIGKLLEVGKDFVAIGENGSNTVVVCATNKIKFINIYNY